MLIMRIELSHTRVSACVGGSLSQSGKGTKISSTSGNGIFSTGQALFDNEIRTRDFVNRREEIEKIHAACEAKVVESNDGLRFETRQNGHTILKRP